MPTLAVLELLAACTGSNDPVWGLRICEQLGLGPGTVYPMLERLEEAGFVDATWEADQPSGRPRRRFYELTNTGRAELAAAVAAQAAKRSRWSAAPQNPAGAA